MLNHIRVSTELKHHLIIAAPSRLPESTQKTASSRVFPPKTAAIRLNLLWLPLSTFRGRKGIYTATVRLSRSWEALYRHRPLFILFYRRHLPQKGFSGSFAPCPFSAIAGRHDGDLVCLTPREVNHQNAAMPSARGSVSTTPPCTPNAPLGRGSYGSGVSTAGGPVQTSSPLHAPSVSARLCHMSPAMSDHPRGAERVSGSPALSPQEVRSAVCGERAQQTSSTMRPPTRTLP